MANLLIIDASSSLCSVSVVVGEQSFHQAEIQPRRHAQRLLPMINEVLLEAGLMRQQLDGVAFGRGPGSFTGIRIAISLVQGISLGLDVPVFGVSSLEMLAAASKINTGEEVVAVLNAHMGEVFWGRYRITHGVAECVGDERVGSPERCAEALAQFTGHVVGNGVKLLPDVVRSRITNIAACANVEPLTEFVVPRIKNTWNRGEFSGIQNHPPVYLRDSVAWKKLDEQPSLLKR